MAASFESTRALLRECLNYPGQSYGTITRAIGGRHPSMVRSWIDGKTTPKRQQDWPRIQKRVRRCLTALQHTGADPELCDADWSAYLERYLADHQLTAEAFAQSVGTTDWHGRRWVKFGEVPHDAARPSVERRTGFNFTVSAYRRAVAAARAQLGHAFPSPLDAVETAAVNPGVSAAVLHDGIRAALADARKRSGVTTAQLARKTGSTHPCVDFFSSKLRDRIQYSAGMLATLLVGLSRYLPTLPTSDGDPLGDALALLQQRPPPPRGVSRRHRTTVRWDRLETTFRKGTHRLLRYRCPNGEPMATMLVRFCIAYEQSRLKTRDAFAQTSIAVSRLGSWLNGRVLPDFPMLEQLERAVERLEGRATSATAPAGVTAAARAAEPAAAPAVAAASPEPAAPVPTDGAGDILVGAASTLRGIRAMRRAGWNPDGAAREHLIAIARVAMEVGGLTPADLEHRSVLAVSGDRSPAVAAFREIAPTISRSRRGKRRP